MTMATIRGLAFCLAVALGTAAPVLDAQRAGTGRDPRLSEAAGMLQLGAQREAIALLEAVVQDRPNDAEGHLRLGLALSLIPRRNEAVQALLRAIELSPDLANVHALVGAAFARLGEQAAALEVLERAVSMDPDLGDAHLNIALILASKGEFDRAAEHMAKALGLETDRAKRARLRLLNGKLYLERDRLEEATREFERSVALDPESGEAFLSLALARKRLLLEDEAYPILRKAVELAPEDPMAQYHLAHELRRRGNAEAAAEHFLRAHELLPDDQSIVYNLTRTLHQAGRRSESARYREKLARMIELSDRARESELEAARLHEDAVSLEGAGRYVAALDKYRAVLRLQPLNAVARRNLALVLCRLDRWAEGIEELRSVVRDDPDNADAARTLMIVLDQSRRSGRGRAGSTPP